MTEQPAAGIYRRWYLRKWGDARFMALSPLLPSGQGLYIYLLCGPQTASMPGVYVAGRAALAESLGWSPEAFAEAFAEVIGQGLAEFDEKHRLWFVPDAIEENYPASPNVVLSWRSQLAMLPESAMRDRIVAALRARLYTGSEAFGKAFDEACGKPSPKASPKASPGPSPNQRTVSSEQEKKKGAARKTGLAPGFTVSDRVRSWAREKGWEGYLDQHLEHFIGSVTANGTKYLDWDAAFQNYIRRDYGDVRAKLERGRGSNAGAAPSDVFAGAR